MRDGLRVPFWSLPLNLVLILVVTVLALRLWHHPARRLPQDELLAMSLIHREIQAHHVQPVPGEELMQAAMSGMVSALDEHSEYIPPAAAQSFDEQTTGAYEGIGVLMILDDNVPTVLFPFPDGPAARAGFMVGDRLIAVGDQATDTFVAREALDRVRDLLLGPPDSEVQVTVRRGDDSIDLTVERGQVQRTSLKWARIIDPQRRFGYLHLAGFQQRSVEELDQALAELRGDAGGELGGLIIDLRYNLGGLLQESVKFTNRFLKEGTIVALKRRENQIVQRYEAKPAECTLPDIPLVVLMNHHSASASEVFAGALQDHGRARLVGTRSFGKGVVQSIYQWEDLDFRLKLTTAHYYTPNGRNIEKNNRRAEDGDAIGGIPADVIVEVDEELDKRIRAALADTEVPRPSREAARRLSDELGRPFPEPLSTEEDTQLAAALTELGKVAEQRKVVAPNGEGR